MELLATERYRGIGLGHSLERSWREMRASDVSAWSAERGTVPYTMLDLTWQIRVIRMNAVCVNPLAL